MRFLALFALVAFAELATFFWVEARIGLGWAVVLILATAVIGSFLVRQAGLSVLGRLRQKIDRGELPARELSDGAVVLVAGAFLITPGLITDTVGALLLLPPVKDLVYRAVSKRFTSQVKVFTSGFGAPPREPLHGEVIDIDPEDSEAG